MSLRSWLSEPRGRSLRFGEFGMVVDGDWRGRGVGSGPVRAAIVGRAGKDCTRAASRFSRQTRPRSRVTAKLDF